MAILLSVENFDGGIDFNLFNLGYKTKTNLTTVCCENEFVKLIVLHCNSLVTNIVFTRI